MIQCYVRHGFAPTFAPGSEPKLAYICNITPDSEIRPRIMHSHKDELELLLIRSGTGVYIIGDKRYPVTPGDLMIFNSGVLHDEVAETTIGISSYCCAIKGLNLPGLPPGALMDGNISPLLHCGEQFSLMERAFSLIFDEIYSGRKGSEECGHHLMQSLLLMVMRLIRETSVRLDGTETESPILGERIRDYINAHYMEEISLKSISEALHVSPYYLSHVFKQTTGFSPGQYICRRRVGEAQTLLISTRLPITRIADMVGYGNPSHFNVIFAKYTGMSPRQYRKICHTDPLEPEGKQDNEKTKKPPSK